MARSGHCEMLAHGAELGARVGYRLGGVTPDRSASVAAQEAQVDYRLGTDSVDSRQVWFLAPNPSAVKSAALPQESCPINPPNVHELRNPGIKRRLRAGAFPNARPPRRIALTQDSVTRRKRKASGDVRRRQRARRSCLRLGVKQFVMPLWRSSGGAD